MTYDDPINFIHLKKVINSTLNDEIINDLPKIILVLFFNTYYLVPLSALNLINLFFTINVLYTVYRILLFFTINLFTFNAYFLFFSFSSVVDVYIEFIIQFSS